VLAELVDLGMQLARATAAKALADLAQPETPEEQEPPEPPAAPEPLEAAPAATPRRATTRSPGPPKQPDPVTAFLRLATAVCACIALEAQIALGPVTPASAFSPTLRADPRRKPLRDAIIQITERDPDRIDLRRALLARIDADLTLDPDRHQNVHEVFCHILDDFELEPDMSKLSDEIIGMGLYPDDPKLPDDHPFLNPTPHPKATSPP
jgi:hypothetical protein